MAKPLNDKFKDIKNDDLQTQRDAAVEKYNKDTESADPTPEAVEAVTALGDSIDEMDAELATRAENASEASEAFEAAKGRKFGSDKAEAEETAEPAEAEEVEEPEAEVEVEEPAEVAEPIAAATKIDKAKVKTVQTLARRTKRPAVPAENDSKREVSIVAAAETGFAAGTSLTLEQMGEAAIQRLSGMPAPNGDGLTEDIRKFPVAAMSVDYDPRFVIDRPEDAMEVIEFASNEHNIVNAQGQEFDSLVAANGWCAPSETAYDLAEDESLDGILSLPEVQVKRGGIRYTAGPQFADFYANAGFVQTETQAIAGQTKPFYEVSCPTFTEVRLDAIGVGIKVPILLNAAYPEMTRRFTSGTLVAHAHMVNLNVINRMVALSTVRDATVGGTSSIKGTVVGDTMELLGIVIDQRRQSQRLSFNRTVEVVVPFWTQNVLRSDLSRRMGTGPEAITDAMLAAHFATIKANVQYVYDWQPLAATATDLEYPATFKALVYPAGTFVKGVSPVINLSAIYDAASLAVNTYTGLFMEQGLLVAKKQYGSDIVEIPICNAGRVGTANLVCA